VQNAQRVAAIGTVAHAPGTGVRRRVGGGLDLAPRHERVHRLDDEEEHDRGDDPMTTATARSTRLPRKMNFRNSFSIAITS
jgi:hypothetical protein